MTAGRPVRRPRLLLVGLFTLFLGPILLAWYLNVYRPDWLELGATNRGRLVDPARMLSTTGIATLPGSASAAPALRGHWTLVYRTTGRCAAACERALDAMDRVRLALGKDMDRVQRWLVLPRGAATGGMAEVLSRHPGLIAVVATDPWLAAIDAAMPEVSGAVYLVDPEANLVLGYPDAGDAQGMLKDLQRLLRLSKIG